MTYSRLWSFIEVAAVPWWVEKVSFNESFVFSFKFVDVVHFVLFESLPAEKLISYSKKILFHFWYEGNDSVSFHAYLGIGGKLPVSLKGSMSTGEVVPVFCTEPVS